MPHRGSGNGEAFAGHSDCRIPTREELLGIVGCPDTGPPCFDAIFDPMGISHYWSSTPLVSSVFWQMNFYSGQASASDQSFPFCVRAVPTGP
jgi:hypothetical protein